MTTKIDKLILELDNTDMEDSRKLRTVINLARGLEEDLESAKKQAYEQAIQDAVRTIIDTKVKIGMASYFCNAILKHKICTTSSGS